MKDKKDIINFDFQSWPVYKHNWLDILKSLGFKEENGKIEIDLNNPILQSYPSVLEDDGMGYGVNEQYIISADENSIFIDKELPNIDLWVNNEFTPYSFVTNIQTKEKGNITEIKEVNGEIFYLFLSDLGQGKTSKKWVNKNDITYDS